MSIYDYLTEDTGVEDELNEINRKAQVSPQLAGDAGLQSAQVPTLNNQQALAQLEQNQARNNQMFNAQIQQNNQMAQQASAQAEADRKVQEQQAQQMAQQAVKEQQEQQSKNLGKLLTIGSIALTGGFGGGIGSKAGGANYLKLLGLGR